MRRTQSYSYKNILIDATDLFICEYDDKTHELSLSLDSINQTAVSYIEEQQQRVIPPIITIFFFSSPKSPTSFHKKLAGLITCDYDIHLSYECLNEHFDKEHLYLQYAVLSADKEKNLHIRYLTDNNVTLHPTHALSSNTAVIKLFEDTTIQAHTIPQLGSLTEIQQSNIINKIKHHLRTNDKGNVIIYLDIDRTALNNRLADKTNGTCLHQTQIALLQYITNLFSQNPHWKKRIKLYLFTARLKHDLLVGKTHHFCYPQDGPQSATKIIDKIKTKVPNIFEIIGTIYSEEYKHKKYKGDFLINILDLIDLKKYTTEYTSMQINCYSNLKNKDTIHILIDDNIKQCVNFTTKLYNKYRSNNFFTAHIHDESDFTRLQLQQPCKPVPVTHKAPSALFSDSSIKPQFASTATTLRHRRSYANNV